MDVDAIRLIPTPHNRNLPPNWRWERARWLRDQGKRCGGGEDPWVRLAVRFQRELDRATTAAAAERLERRYPAVWWAWYWYQSAENRTRWMTEAYLVADASPDSVGERCGLSPETVAVYATLFFDVRGRRRNWGYMLNSVFHKSVHAGLSERDYDLLWKLVGLVGGPFALDAFILPAPLTTVTSADTGGAFAHDLYRGTIRNKALVAGLTMPVAYNQEVILVAYNKLREMERAGEGGGGAAGLILNNIDSMVRQLSFVTGRPARSAGDPRLRRYDDCAVELRAAEQVRLSMGDVAPPALITDKAFPEARDEPTRQGS